jgi:hypothetical protein
LNRTNNIVDPNIGVTQSKVFLDPPLGGVRGGDIFTPRIFVRLPLETYFREKISGVLLEML